MQKFWELLERSTILQAVLTLLCAGTVCYMYLTGQEVPDSLVNIVMLIVGYYFGAKTVSEASRFASGKRG